MSDNRGATLVHTPTYNPRVRTIPRKRPATIDSVEELESDNAPRKPLLAAHTSRAGVDSSQGICRNRFRAPLLGFRRRRVVVILEPNSGNQTPTRAFTETASTSCLNCASASIVLMSFWRR
jgi:hypothetical protein